MRIDSWPSGAWCTRETRPCAAACTARAATAGMRKPIWPKSSFRSSLARSSATRRRRDVVEEAAPLVVDDEQRAAPVVAATARTRATTSAIHAWPRRTSPCGCSSADVAVAAAAVAERRVDDRDVRQRAERAVGVVLGERPRPRRAARAPDRRERQVGVVVAGAHAAAERAVEDRLPLVAGGLDRRRVVLPAARLRRPLVVAVGPGRAEQRAEVPVVERELLGGGVDEPELALVVVGQRELVVAAALGQEAALQLRAARVPAVPGVGVRRSPATRPRAIGGVAGARPPCPSRRRCSSGPGWRRRPSSQPK